MKNKNSIQKVRTKFELYFQFALQYINILYGQRSQTSSSEHTEFRHVTEKFTPVYAYWFFRGINHVRLLIAMYFMSMAPRTLTNHETIVLFNDLFFTILLSRFDITF